MDVRLAEVTDLPLENVLNLVLQGNDPPFTYVIVRSSLIGPSDSVRTMCSWSSRSFRYHQRQARFPCSRLALESSQDGDDGGAGGLFDIGGEEDSGDDS